MLLPHLHQPRCFQGWAALFDGAFRVRLLGAGRRNHQNAVHARHEIASLANADGELPQAAVILQDVLERLLNEIPQISDE